jgi:uncharacterized protein
MTTVCNSSPLIRLSAIGLLDLLHALYGTIHIPYAVYQEVVVNGKARAGARRVARTSWITDHTLADQQAVKVFRKKTKLQQGESEAILLVLQLDATTLIVDDASARAVASAHKLPVIGTAGVLLLAKHNQIIPSLKKPMDALVAYGIRIGPLLYQAALRSAGE